MESVAFAYGLWENFTEEKDGSDRDENGGKRVEEAIQKDGERFEACSIDEEKGGQEPVWISEEL